MIWSHLLYFVEVIDVLGASRTLLHLENSLIFQIGLPLQESWCRIYLSLYLFHHKWSSDPCDIHHIPNLSSINLLQSCNHFIFIIFVFHRLLCVRIYPVGIPIKRFEYLILMIYVQLFSKLRFKNYLIASPAFFILLRDILQQVRASSAYLYWILECRLSTSQVNILMLWLFHAFLLFILFWE